MLLALLLAVLGPDYRAQPQCLVNVGCAVARWPDMPNPKPVPRCPNAAPALTVAAALHEATSGWRRLFGWIWVPRVRIAARLRSGPRGTTLMMCQLTALCCNRVTGTLVLADDVTGVQLPLTTHTGDEGLKDLLGLRPSCIGDESRLCCEYEPTVQVVADGRLLHDGEERWHLEGATLCTP